MCAFVKLSELPPVQCAVCSVLTQFSPVSNSYLNCIVVIVYVLERIKMKLIFKLRPQEARKKKPHPNQRETMKSKNIKKEKNGSKGQQREQRSIVLLSVPNQIQ